MITRERFPQRDVVKSESRARMRATGVFFCCSGLGTILSKNQRGLFAGAGTACAIESSAAVVAAFPLAFALDITPTPQLIINIFSFDTRYARPSARDRRTMERSTVLRYVIRETVRG